MDLHLTAAAATDEERAAVDGLLGAPESGWHGAGRDEVTHRVARGGRAARDERHLLLPALHALQARVGWISEGGLNYVCERLTIPPAEAYGVATFYAMFSVEPRARTVVHVCDDLACRVGRRRGDLRASGGGRTARPGRRPRARATSPGCGARAWACASAHPRSCTSRRARARRTWSSRPPPRSRPPRWAAGRGWACRTRLPRSAAPICACCDASASSTRAPSTTTTRTGGIRRSGARSSSAPRARSPRSPTRS